MSVVAAEAVEAAVVVEEEEDPVLMAVVVAEWELEPVSLSTPSVFVLGSEEKGAQICTYHLYRWRFLSGRCLGWQPSAPQLG